MLQNILIGIGAGMAAALLFGSPIGGTVLAMPLFALTGLPIASAGLGWTPIAGIVAAIVGGAAVFIFLSPLAAGIFLLIFGLPLVWLTRLAGLSRQEGSDLEWYPLGRILAHAAIAVLLGLAAVGYLIGFDPEPMAAGMVEALTAWLAERPDIEPRPSMAELEPFIRFNVAILPYTVAAIMTMIIVVDLWLAEIVTRASGRLARPRQRLCMVSVSTGVALAFPFVLAASFLPFPLGNIAALATGALGFVLMLVGLAVLHAITLGHSARTAILTFTYVVLVVLGFPILLFIALGLVETLLYLRQRRFGGAPPTI